MLFVQTVVTMVVMDKAEACQKTMMTVNWERRLDEGDSLTTEMTSIKIKRHQHLSCSDASSHGAVQSDGSMFRGAASRCGKKITFSSPKGLCG